MSAHPTHVAATVTNPDNRLDQGGRGPRVQDGRVGGEALRLPHATLEAPVTPTPQSDP
jgi:hypothetical protein